MSLTKQKQIFEFNAPTPSDNGKVLQYNSTSGKNEYVTPTTGAVSSVADTASVDLTITSGVLTADIVPSSTVGNDITVDANGVFLDVQAAETTTTITNTVSGHKVADYTNEDGTVVAVNETVTTASYNSSTHIFTYTGEDGTPVNIDLSGLATDIFVNGATYNSSTGLLTLTDNDTGTPDVTVQIHPPVVANDSNTINFTQSGTDNQTITADVILDPANGGLTATANGILFNADGANTYNNATSGLTATTVQDAIDELETKFTTEIYEAFTTTATASTNFSVTLTNSIAVGTVADVYINGENVNEYVVSASGTTVTINVPYAVDTTDTIKVIYSY